MNNQISNLTAQALSGQTTTESKRRNLPNEVIQIPLADEVFESAVFGPRKTNEGPMYSHSLSRVYYNKAGEKKLSRTFNVDPCDAMKVLYSLNSCWQRFAEDPRLDPSKRAGLADISLRLSTAFEFGALARAIQAAETQLNGSALSQQAPNGNGYNIPNSIGASS